MRLPTGRGPASSSAVRLEDLTPEAKPPYTGVVEEGPTMQTARIPLANLGLLTDRLAQVNKRAARIGQPPLVLEILGQFIREYLEDGLLMRQQVVEYRIVGTPPKIDGWDLVAAIDLTANGNIVKMAPRWVPVGDTDAVLMWDREADPAWLALTGRCDYCGKVRKRTKVMVLENAAGERKLVGRNCVRDFIGYEIPNGWDMTLDLGDVTDNRGGGPQTFDAVTVATYAAAAIRLFGWVAMGNQNATAIRTRARVEKWLAGTPQQREEYGWNGKQTLTQADADLARDAVEWITTQADTTTDQFLNNLKVAVLNPVTTRTLALVVALVPAFNRANAAATPRPDATTAAAAAPKTRVPEGTDVTIAGVVLKMANKETDYGVRTVMTVLDDRGFKVWGTVPKDITVEVGDRLTFVADLQQADGDPYFGFFKRPRNPAKVAAPVG